MSFQPDLHNMWWIDEALYPLLGQFVMARRTQESHAKAQRREGISSLRLCALYVQKVFHRFYFPSSCSRDDERSEESCEHDGQPTTDRASASNGRRRAWYRPATCRFARTVDRAHHGRACPSSFSGTLAFARKGRTHDRFLFSTRWFHLRRHRRRQGQAGPGSVCI